MRIFAFGFLFPLACMQPPCIPVSYNRSASDKLLTTVLLDSAKLVWQDCHNPNNYNPSDSDTFTTYADAVHNARVVSIPVLYFSIKKLEKYNFNENILCFMKKSDYDYTGFILKNNRPISMISTSFSVQKPVRYIGNALGCETYERYLKYSKTFFYWADTHSFVYTDEKGVCYVYDLSKGWSTMYNYMEGEQGLREYKSYKIHH